MAQELASRPVMFMARKDVLRNCASICPTPNAPITCGIATNTLELVNMAVKKAASAALVASQRAAKENCGAEVVDEMLVIRLKRGPHCE